MRQGGSSPLVDGLLLGAGTFTAVTVPPPGSVDSRRAATALLVAPGLGALLALAAGGAGAALIAAAEWAGNGGPWIALLAAAIAVTGLAWGTRGLHLDGLADLADGLGSNRSGAEALAIMRDPRTGAFAVIALITVMLVQVAAVAAAYGSGHGLGSLVAAAAMSRATLAWTCRRGTPSDDSGLGRAVVGSTPGRWALTAGLCWTALAAAVAVAAGASVLAACAAAAGVWGAAALLRRRAIKRLDAVTGDVLGATVEVCTTVALVALAVLG